MMQKDNGFVPLESFSSEDHCFACGSKNPFGLHMKLFTDGNSVICDIVVPGHLSGWGNLVHGGIITTLLDETMSWTAIHLLKRLILTRCMEIEFILPVAPNIPLRTEGRIQERIKNTAALVNGVLYDPAGRACARSRGRFALISAKMMRRMKIMGEQVISDFERFYGSV
ncbi:MAG: PaaI family thioesterase [Desulfobacteraceae bacterium]|nr:MAG: PaaI family thioesterase [Desulfobacteraceae bacterium]